MFNLGVMFIVALIVGFIVYMQIQKVSKKLDEIEQNPDMSRYFRLCDAIALEIDGLSRKFQLGDVTLKDSGKNDEFRLNLDGLLSEISFIKTMHETNQNSSTWEEKLFAFLKKFEEFIETYLQNSNEINDEIRDRLQKEFQA